MAAEEEDEDIWDSWEDMADSGVKHFFIESFDQAILF